MELSLENMKEIDGMADQPTPAALGRVDSGTPMLLAPTPTGAILLNTDPESREHLEAAAAVESPAKRPRHGERQGEAVQEGESGLTPQLTTASLDTQNSFEVLEGGASESDGGSDGSLELVLDADAMPPPRALPSSASGGGSYGRSASTERKRPPELALHPATPGALSLCLSVSLSLCLSVSVSVSVSVCQ